MNENQVRLVIAEAAIQVAAMPRISLPLLRSSLS